MINRYDDLLYESRPTSLTELLNNKNNNVHEELYKDALDKYINKQINVFIDSTFMFEFFKMYKEYEDDFNIYNMPDNELLQRRLSGLSLDYESTLLSLYKLTKSKFEIIDSMFDEIHAKEDIVPMLLQVSASLKDFLFSIVDNDNDEEIVVMYNNSIGDIDVSIIYDFDGNWIFVCTDEASIDYLNDLKNNDCVYNKNKDDLMSLYNNDFYNLFNKYHKFIEVKNSEYWMPSSVYIINKVKPFLKKVIKLDEFWNNIQSNSNSEWNEIKMTNENILDSELTYINYVSGIAKMYSKSNDMTYEIPFKYLNSDTNVSDEMTLENTFTYKYNNLTV